MKVQRYDLLSKLDEKLDSDYREMLDDIIDKGIDVSSRTLKKIGRIDRIYERAHKMPIWPFEASGFVLFLTAVFVPVLSVIAITF